jgi:hypothetical protein
MMGIVGTASFLALISASKSLAESTAATAAATTAEVDTQNVADTDSNANLSTSSSSSSSCAVLCHRGCSSPGHCRRYVDTSNNNRCDLSECI